MRLQAISGGDAHVRLSPLDLEDSPGLAALADANPGVFQHWPRGGWHSYTEEITSVLADQERGRVLCHVVRTPFGEIVGQTAYLNIRPEHAGVEIGMTWYAPNAQGGPINPASKRLMLANAFAAGAERVELKTDARNTRSRAAILKLGAVFEGIHRRHMRRPDGAWRDTAWYSILRDDWPSVRAGLDARLAAFENAGR